MVGVQKGSGSECILNVGLVAFANALPVEYEREGQVKTGSRVWSLSNCKNGVLVYGNEEM